MKGLTCAELGWNYYGSVCLLKTKLSPLVWKEILDLLDIYPLDEADRDFCDEKSWVRV